MGQNAKINSTILHAKVTLNRYFVQINWEQMVFVFGMPQVAVVKSYQNATKS